MLFSQEVRSFINIRPTNSSSGRFSFRPFEMLDIFGSGGEMEEVCRIWRCGRKKGSDESEDKNIILCCFRVFHFHLNAFNSLSIANVLFPCLPLMCKANVIFPNCFLCVFSSPISLGKWWHFQIILYLLDFFFLNCYCLSSILTSDCKIAVRSSLPPHNFSVK